MPRIKSFRDLNVYQAARVETQKIYVRSRSFPAEEQYSLTDQMRRSSRAVKAMLNKLILRADDFCGTQPD